MFIFTINEERVVQTVTLGNRKRYDDMRADNPALLFLEERDVTALYTTQDFLLNPGKYKLLYGNKLLKIA